MSAPSSEDARDVPPGSVPLFRADDPKISAYLAHLVHVGDEMAAGLGALFAEKFPDGFHILGIDFRDQPAMSWQCAITGQTYLYQVLPFGYKLSPYAFCRAMETFTRVLRSPDLPVTGRGTPEALLAAITSDLKQSRLSSAQ